MILRTVIRTRRARARATPLWIVERTGINHSALTRSPHTRVSHRGPRPGRCTGAASCMQRGRSGNTSIARPLHVVCVNTRSKNAAVTWHTHGDNGQCSLRLYARSVSADSHGTDNAPPNPRRPLSTTSRLCHERCCPQPVSVQPLNLCTGPQPAQSPAGKRAARGAQQRKRRRRPRPLPLRPPLL